MWWLRVGTCFSTFFYGFGLYLFVVVRVVVFCGCVRVCEGSREGACVWCRCSRVRVSISTLGRFF